MLLPGAKSRRLRFQMIADTQVNGHELRITLRTGHVVSVDTAGLCNSRPGY